MWTSRLFLGLIYAPLMVAVELWVAFGLFGIEHDAGVAQVWAFLALAIATTFAAAMLLVTLLGPAGIGVAAALTILLGLVSSGGNAPFLEALPGFYRAYADWLPVRYVIDGLRSLLFYDGSPGAARLEGVWRDPLWFLGSGGRSETAGLEDAIWVLGALLAGLRYWATRSLCSATYSASGAPTRSGTWKRKIRWRTRSANGNRSGGARHHDRLSLLCVPGLGPVLT